MTKRIPKDLRSTGRRRARKALFDSGITFECAHCGAVPQVMPKDFPRKNPPPLGRSSKTCTRLEAQHKNKDMSDNDVGNLEFLCPSCHKNADKVTAKGVSTVQDQFGASSLL